jgi:YidC/Oxa1 family membrane protein insertase
MTAATTSNGGIFHSITAIFHPIFSAFGWLLAALYGIIPNYAVAITLLTLIIMGLLTPFTVKSTKSMMAMQRLQPEIKKLQVKYKGPENRALLNEEMMKLYKEEGANPLGGCLPVLLQAPFLFILYSVIRGLSYVNPLGNAAPKYIPIHGRMWNNVVSAHGHISAFGMDLSLKPFSPHSSWITAIPFYLFVLIAVALQYFQMWQMNARNKKTGQAVPSQQQTIQRIMPIFFTYFYIVIPAAVVLYMIVSTLVRIATQDVMFRTGVSNPQKIAAAKERNIPAREIEGSTAAALSESESEAAPAAKPAPSAKKNTQPSTPKPPSHPRSSAKRKRKDR